MYMCMSEICYYTCTVCDCRILYKISTFLRSRSPAVRAKARSTLIKILLSLGARYVRYFFKELTGTLQKGFQVSEHLLQWPRVHIIIMYKNCWSQMQLWLCCIE